MKHHPDQIARRQMMPTAQNEHRLPIKPKPALFIKKLHPDAKVPTKAHSTDAGYDLYSMEDKIIESNNWTAIETGIAMAIPKGYAGLIWPRSGLSFDYGLDVLAGVIDSGFRNYIKVILSNPTEYDYEVTLGDRIAQIVFQKVEDFDFMECDVLPDSDRGEKGFGSSG